MKKIQILLALSLTTQLAISAPNYWVAGYGQGYAEYRIDHPDGIGLMISCNDASADDWDHHVSVLINGDTLEHEEEEFPSIEIHIDNDIYFAPDETFTRSGSESWGQLTNALSTANKFQLFWAGEYLGEFNPKNTKKIAGDLSSCLSMIDRNIMDNSEDIGENQINRQSENLALEANSIDVKYRVIQQEYGVTTTYIYVLSRENSIAIEGIKLNRGNCPLYRGERGGVSQEFTSRLPKGLGASLSHAQGKDNIFPVSIGYGQETYFVFQNCPNVLEVDVITNKGSASYQF